MALATETTSTEIVMETTTETTTETATKLTEKTMKRMSNMMHGIGQPTLGHLGNHEEHLLGTAFESIADCLELVGIGGLTFERRAGGRWR